MQENGKVTDLVFQVIRGENENLEVLFEYL